MECFQDLILQLNLILKVKWGKVQEYDMVSRNLSLHALPPALLKPIDTKIKDEQVGTYTW